MNPSPLCEAQRPRPSWCVSSVIYCFLVAAGLLSVCSSSARILRTRQTPSESWEPWLPLTVGSSIEFETSEEQSQTEFPMFVEYNFTQTLKLTVEPTVVHIAPKAKDESTVTGLGDLETGLEYEFVRERRYRPALTAETLIRWPTATDPEIGDPGVDYSFGLIASKDLVFVDLDLRALYTLVADREEQDNLRSLWPGNGTPIDSSILKLRSCIPLVRASFRAKPDAFREAGWVEQVRISPRGRLVCRGR